MRRRRSVGEVSGEQDKVTSSGAKRVEGLRKFFSAGAELQESLRVRRHANVVGRHKPSARVQMRVMSSTAARSGREYAPLISRWHPRHESMSLIDQESLVPRNRLGDAR